jgi:hypothetical protein
MVARKPSFLFASLLELFAWLWTHPKKCLALFFFLHTYTGSWNLFKAIEHQVGNDQVPEPKETRICTESQVKKNALVAVIVWINIFWSQRVEASLSLRPFLSFFFSKKMNTGSLV